jgi:hypothetical protein
MSLVGEVRRFTSMGLEEEVCLVVDLGKEEGWKDEEAWQAL